MRAADLRALAATTMSAILIKSGFVAPKGDQVGQVALKTVASFLRP